MLRLSPQAPAPAATMRHAAAEISMTDRGWKRGSSTSTMKRGLSNSDRNDYARMIVQVHRLLLLFPPRSPTYQAPAPPVACAIRHVEVHKFARAQVLPVNWFRTLPALSPKPHSTRGTCTVGRQLACGISPVSCFSLTAKPPPLAHSSLIARFHQDGFAAAGHRPCHAIFD